MISPVALHQQQQPFLPQKKGFPMAADKSGDAHPAFSTRGIHQRSVSDSSTITGNISSQSWANFSYQVPGNVPLARQLYSNNSSQVMNFNRLKRDWYFPKALKSDLFLFLFSYSR